MGETRTPPAEVTLRWCSKCPRTDRSNTLKPGHYWQGERCGGVINETVYAPSLPVGGDDGRRVAAASQLADYVRAKLAEMVSREDPPGGNPRWCKGWRDFAHAAGVVLPGPIADEAARLFASLSSPLPGAGDGRSTRWFRVTNAFDGPVPMEDRHRTYEAAAAELSRLDREFPAYAPFKVQTQVETHSGWVDAPAPADDKETTR